MARKDWYYVNFPKLMIKRLNQFLKTPKAQSLGLTNKSELLRHAVNNFLDDQDDFFNKIESIKDFVAQLNDHDHVLIDYNTNAELNEILMSFMERGIKNNQLNVLAISKRDKQTFVDALEKSDINVDEMINSQDLVVILAEDFFKKPFTVDRYKKEINLLIDLAKRKKRTGINWLGTFPDYLISERKYNEATKFEQTVHNHVQELKFPLTPICIYRVIPKSHEKELIKNHDITIKRAITATGLQ